MKKIKFIGKILLGFLLLLVAALTLVIVLFFNVNGKEQANKEQYLSVDSSEKSALILYQESRMGLTKKAVDIAVSTLQNEGYSVMLNHPREDSEYNVQDYDIIVLASPVYAGQVSKSLLDYASNQNFANKKVLIMLTGSDLKQTEEIECIKAQVRNAGVLQGIKVDEADERVSSAVKELTE